MDVVFAVVPFADVGRPSIGVSLLTAGIGRFCSASVEYLNLDFAATIGRPLYDHFCHEVQSDTMAGEWFFADLLFAGRIPPAHEFAERVLRRVTAPDIFAEMDRARATREAFIDRSAARLAALHPRIVGFTTTFHQTCACLAIAKRLKEVPNPPLIAFGGANCEGVMGQQLLDSFPWVDVVCTREGDAVFPAFVERVLAGGASGGGHPGLLIQGESNELSYPPVVDCLDELPIPRYDDYFEQLAASPLAADIQPALPVETARGCWWGAKHHCTFCGLNGDTMRFRSKSPRRVIDELCYLRQRYGTKRIDSVDNILDLRYTKDVFPELKRVESDCELFFEVKANLTYEQLKSMYDGGVRAIQPGIESLSDDVLALMRKGVTGLQNIQLLRWSEEVGILPAWNLLAGFPGEDPAEYEWTSKLIPTLMHLEPPTAFAPIRLDRFSPFFENGEEFGFRRVRPAYAYYYVFPFGRRELERLAYFFDFDYADGRSPLDYMVATAQAVNEWRSARFGANRPTLNAHIQDDGSVHLEDTRPCALFSEHVLKECDADIYLACDSVRTTSGLVRQFSARYLAEEVQQSLDGLVKEQLLVERRDHYLSLGVLRNRPADVFDFRSQSGCYVPKAPDSIALLRVL